MINGTFLVIGLDRIAAVSSPSPDLFCFYTITALIADLGRYPAVTRLTR